MLTINSGQSMAKFVALLIFLVGGGISWAEPSDVLYIGSNNVKTFNANTGQYLGALGTSCDP